MKKFELKATRVEKAVFINNLPPNIKIELSNKYSYSVAYSGDSSCTGEFSAEVYDKNEPDRFRIEVILKGFLELYNVSSKERIHILSYNSLFPYVKAFIAGLTVNSGVPVINIPFVDISDQNIYRVEMPGRQ